MVYNKIIIPLALVGCELMITDSVLRTKSHIQQHATSANNSQHCWVLLANNVASVCMGQKVWMVSNYTQQVPTSANIVVVPGKRTQQVTPLLGPTMLGPFAQTDVTSAISSRQHCWMLLANNVASVCMGLKVWPVSNYTQQVPTIPTLLWFHANGRNKSQHCWAQQCWVLLANNVGSVCMRLNCLRRRPHEPGYFRKRRFFLRSTPYLKESASTCSVFESYLTIHTGIFENGDFLLRI